MPARWRPRCSQWPAHISFLASFLFIGVTWTNHHATFRQISSADRGVTWANLGILCGTVLLPFPTGVVADAFRTGSHADELEVELVQADTFRLARDVNQGQRAGTRRSPLPRVADPEAPKPDMGHVLDAHRVPSPGG